MKKQLLSTLICLTMGTSIINPFFATVSSAADLDFEGSSLGADVKSSKFILDDGATVELSNAATGVSAVIKNSDAVVPGNPSTNKFIKFDYNGDAGETASRIKITPTEAIKNDFVLEFDYALNCVGGTKDDYTPYESFIDVTYFPNMQVEANHMWKYGSRAVVLDQTYRVKTPKSDMITPNFWSGYNNYATGYVGNSGFATMKIITRFMTNDYPVYDVYVKLPGSDSFKKIVTGKQYATSGYGSAELAADDYNNHGFKYFYLEMIAGHDTASRTADRILDAAIDNIKVYDYFPEINLNFDNETLDSDVKAATFNTGDGSVAEFGAGATNASVKIKNSDEVVPGNASSNKFVKFDYTGADGETTSRLKITPATPLKEDFILEFDYALNCVTGSYADYSPYESFIDITYFPDIQRDSGNMWKYGSRAVVLDQTYRVKTPKTNLIVPDFWSGYTNYATGYVGNSGFATMKIVTRFIENDYPVYDVYVKLPGSNTFKEIATGKKYATSGYSNATLTAEDYNDYGFKYLYLEMIGGHNASSRAADRILDAAIDNVKIYKYELPKFDGNFDFEDDNLFGEFNRAYGSNASASVAFNDGSSFVSEAAVSDIKITDNGFVKNNEAGNKYLQMEFKGNDYSTEATKLRFNFGKAFKEDFTVEFKYAVDSNYPVSNTYTGENGKTYYTNSYSFVMDANPDAEQWNYASRLLFVNGVRTYALPKTTAPSTAAAGAESLGDDILSLGGFETIKIETKFHKNSVPTFDVFRKEEGKDYWECIVKDVTYSTKYYNKDSWSATTGGDLTAEYYNTNGIERIAMDFVGDSIYKALSDEHYMKIAIDDVKFYKTNSNRIEIQKAGVKDSENNSITEGTAIAGKTLYPDVSVANYYNNLKNITVLVATYNNDGLMTGMELKQVELSANAVTEINSGKFDGVNVTEEGYVRLYILDGLDGLNTLTDVFSSER